MVGRQKLARTIKPGESCVFPSEAVVEIRSKQLLPKGKIQVCQFTTKSIPGVPKKLIGTNNPFPT